MFRSHKILGPQKFGVLKKFLDPTKFCVKKEFGRPKNCLTKTI